MREKKVTRTWEQKQGGEPGTLFNKGMLMANSVSDALKEAAQNCWKGEEPSPEKNETDLLVGHESARRQPLG